MDERHQETIVVIVGFGVDCWRCTVRLAQRADGGRIRTIAQTRMRMLYRIAQRKFVDKSGGDHYRTSAHTHCHQVLWCTGGCRIHGLVAGTILRYLASKTSLVLQTRPNKPPACGSTSFGHFSTGNIGLALDMRCRFVVIAEQREQHQ
jgi:hypothetical protein